MRILLLCEHFHPNVDACAKRMKVMADELIACGHDVQILASETSLPEEKDSYATPENVHFYPVFKIGTKTVFNRLRNNWSEKAGSERVAKGLGHFDIVVVTSPPLMLAMSGIRIAKTAGAKLVFDVRDIWPEVAYEMGSFKPSSIYGRVFSRLAKKAYSSAILITTVTEGKAKKLEKSLCGELADKVRVVPNGLDVEFLQCEEDAEIVREYRLDEGPLCVYVGNLGLAQGLSSLLKIAAVRPEVRFLLFGSGAEESLLRKAIAEKRLKNVAMCGRVGERGVYTILRHASLAYVPLLNSALTSSIPTKLYEALGCGCPVVLAAQGDSVRVLDEVGLGCAAPPEDDVALLSAFDAVLSRTWSTGERRQASELIVARHSRQAAARVFEELLVCEVSGNRSDCAAVHGVSADGEEAVFAEDEVRSVVHDG